MPDRGPTSPFSYLTSQDAPTQNLWGWAKRLVDALRRFKLFALMDIPIDDKPYFVIRVNADGTAFELAPEELGLTGEDLAGKANMVVRVNATGTGFEITAEELGLYGVSLAGKANYYVKVNGTATGYTLSAT